MEDLSNKSLAVLVGIAIIVSFIGIFIGKAGITGLATESGRVNVTIAVNIDITATDDVIEFGSMSNSEWNHSEILNVSGNGPDNITIQNVGTTPVDVDYYANASLFVIRNTTGTANNGSVTDEAYRIKVLDNGTCTVAVAPYDTTYTDVLVSGTTSNRTQIIGGCSQNDEFTVGSWVHIPALETSGTKTSRIYFVATEYTP